MTVDHVGQPLRKYTLQTFGYVSAIGGFIFLSGLVAGFVYAKYLEQGRGKLWRSALKRAWVLYVAHLVLLVFFAVMKRESLQTALVWLLPIGQPDILPLYMIFLLFTPLLLIGYRRKMDWLILLISFLLWGITQFGLMEPFRKILISQLNTPVHNLRIFAWQFLFVVGTWLGYRLVYEKSLRIPKNHYLVGIAMAFVLAMFLVRHGLLRADEINLFVTQWSKSIPRLGWLRLLNVFVLAYVFALVASTRERLLHCRWLELLGRHALQVYIYHVIVIILLRAVRTQGHLSGNIWGLVIALVLVASLTIPALIHERYMVRRKARVTGH